MAVGQGQPSVINGATITGRGIKNVLNITTNTLVKGSQGRIANVNVTTAGSGAGAVYDAASVASITTATAASKLVAVIPNTIGAYSIDFPCLTGIVVEPGTGQVVSVSYN